MIYRTTSGDECRKYQMHVATAMSGNNKEISNEQTLNLSAVLSQCKSYRNTRKVCDKSLIVGGDNADPKEFPFMALLFYINGHERIVMCGGSLVSDRYVVIAACILDNEMVTKFYKEKTTDGRDFPQFLATGWGTLKDYGRSPSHLQKVKLDNFNDELCLSKVDKAAITINTTIQMWAGSYYYERDICAGDSGGPLFVDHPDYNCLFLVLGVLFIPDLRFMLIG
ncbi:trypsin-like [Musca vetustissima]|uniref:trypsin-like n=1 Tax=Musca vetustissima TaxID=27455 RepID=UPI002AB5EA1F|nr:trypsin-like [Musca vetustissima]